MTTAVPAFPLPPGHRFGLGYGDLQLHDGREAHSDWHFLRMWQAAYAQRDRDYPDPSGVYDGPCQRAVHSVQRAIKAPVTGEIDPDTWSAVWDGRLDPAPKAPGYVSTVAPTLGKLEGVLDTAGMKTARVRARAETSSANKVIYRNRHKGESPEWYTLPDEEFQAKIRSILGMRATTALEARVKGIQRAAGVPATGTVDVATAWLIEESVVR